MSTGNEWLYEDIDKNFQPKNSIILDDIEEGNLFSKDGSSTVDIEVSIPECTELLFEKELIDSTHLVEKYRSDLKWLRIVTLSAFCVGYMFMDYDSLFTHDVLFFVLLSALTFLYFPLYIMYSRIDNEAVFSGESKSLYDGLLGCIIFAQVFIFFDFHYVFLLFTLLQGLGWNTMLLEQEFEVLNEPILRGVWQLHNIIYVLYFCKIILLIFR